MVVTIYTSPTCQYCKLAKQFFRRHGVRFVERNVADVKVAQEMVNRTKQMAVPAVIVEDKGTEQLVIGFQESELMKLLEIGG